MAPPDFKSPMAIAAPPVYVPLVMQREAMPGVVRRAASAELVGALRSE